MRKVSPISITEEMEISKTLQRNIRNYKILLNDSRCLLPTGYFYKRDKKKTIT